MPITDYHAKYLAYELTRRYPAGDVDTLASALVDAQVELNPHQVDAALFAFRSPLSPGALLADEVGLGKTIEAGLVISQRWAERRHRILVVTPANLRKQWHQELTEKFFLPCRILEAGSYREAVKAGNPTPLSALAVVICSYEFARAREHDVAAMPWDLVVLDEAHRLRNVYKPSNVTARTLKRALGGRQKLLLTATPLQNSLLELYGLVSFIDEHTFGDLASFREQFTGAGHARTLEMLRARIAPICHRTLRRQVEPYVKYTRRRTILEPFTPEANEQRLYDLVSEYLQRDNLQALPSGQRALITLVLRKLLASSSFAIAGALHTMAERLRVRLRAAPGGGPEAAPVDHALEEDYEALDETADEWAEDTKDAPLGAADRDAMQREVDDLERFAELATTIDQNAKGTALLKGLDRAFAHAREHGAPEKAIIFTESRRTQSYLLQVLGGAGYADDVVLFNGSNTDAGSKAVYAEWLSRHRGTDRVTGSRTADMRSALVEHFRDRARIMIATEAGAEGINLQFCALVVNYDLPWNPQRIEQRIGRCHRYGQKHDVVVVNFLNQQNAADARVLELLSEKFSLFEGVFGASDEVLGTVESGVDFERRIADIYQRCRQPDEIATAFDRLQAELSGEIDAAMTDTRRKLLDHFDEEVREKLRTRQGEAEQSLNRFEQQLMRLTRHELAGHATFAEGDGAFTLDSSPVPDNAEVPLGRYELPRRSGDAHFYRLGHPLAREVLGRAVERQLPAAEVRFDYTTYRAGGGGKLSVVEPLLGCAGWLALSRLRIESQRTAGEDGSPDRVEDYLLFAGTTDDGKELDDDLAQKLLAVDGAVVREAHVPDDVRTALDVGSARQQAVINQSVAARNADLFETEAAKLDAWADDLKVGLERAIKEIDQQIKDARRAATVALTLDEKLSGQRRVRALESERNARRRALYDAQDDVDRRREALIQATEARLQVQASSQAVFTIRWSVR